MSDAHVDDLADDDLYPTPEVLRDLLIQRGLEPDDLTQMIDVAAVGIAARWWRNTKAEDWHAGTDVGALSDVDMFRINTRTTARVRDRLRAWSRAQGIHTMDDIAQADPESLEIVLRGLYRWFINPRRVLVDGCTLHGVISQTLTNARSHPECDVPADVTPESELAEYDDQVSQAAGHLLLCMDRHDPRSVFYVPAVFTVLWANGWWCLPSYPAHVDAVFAALDDPGHPRWRGEPIPAPPPGTDLTLVRRRMLTRPWDLPYAVIGWLIHEVGEHYIVG